MAHEAEQVFYYLSLSLSLRLTHTEIHW